MKKTFLILLLVTFFFPLSSEALRKVTLKDGYDRYYFYPSYHKNLYGLFEKYYFNGQEISLSPAEIETLSSYKNLEKKVERGLDRAYLKKFFKEKIALKVDQIGTGAELSFVDSISSSGSTRVSFSDSIFLERKLDLDTAAFLLEKALKDGVDEIELPIFEKEPDLKIPEELKKKGVNGIYSVSKSDFSSSSPQRIHNIQTAMKRFEGLVILPGEEFSFNENLGEVNGFTGFEKEFVIKETSVTKEYGGGVCQVSTTLYRSLMNGGFEISNRRNHSFAVDHYEPQGSDATIYLGVQDLKFKNTTSGSVVLHGVLRGDFAYFVILGPKEQKPKTKLFGPYISNVQSPPGDRLLPSATLADGKKIKLVSAQKGFTSTWFRVVDGKIEIVQSKYKPVPNTWKVGGLNEEVLASQKNDLTNP